MTTNSAIAYLNASTGWDINCRLGGVLAEYNNQIVMTPAGADVESVLCALADFIKCKDAAEIARLTSKSKALLRKIRTEKSDG